MSAPGRKSIVSHEQQSVVYDSQKKQSRNQFYKGVIIDICGAHHPKSEFYTESFHNGIFFIVAIKELADVFPIYWRQGYDLLRSIYGVDENIIGRQCIVRSESSDKFDILYSELEIGIGLNNYYQDELTNTYISTGWAGGISTNSSTLKNFMTNRTAGPGEIWFRSKK
jgi:hypothetical protein